MLVSFYSHQIQTVSPLFYNNEMEKASNSPDHFRHNNFSFVWNSPIPVTSQPFNHPVSTLRRSLKQGDNTTPLLLIVTEA